MIEFDPDMELEWWVGPDVTIRFEGREIESESEETEEDA